MSTEREAIEALVDSIRSCLSLTIDAAVEGDSRADYADSKWDREFAKAKVVFFGPTLEGVLGAVGGTLIRLHQARCHVSIQVACDQRDVYELTRADMQQFVRRTLRSDLGGVPVSAFGYSASDLCDRLPLEAAARLNLERGDLVFAPWRHDGVPHHDACGRIALAAARSVGAGCVQYPLSSATPNSSKFLKLHAEPLLQHLSSSRTNVGGSLAPEAAI